MEVGVWQLMIVLAIVVVLFGTKKIRNIGGDLGGAVRNFKSAMREGDGEVVGLVKDVKSSVSFPVIDKVNSEEDH